MKKFVVVDGNAILHRAWHALPPSLTKADGTIVNAVYGFISILLKTIEELQPTHVAVAWDTAADTFRDEIYEDYKGTRESKEDELYAQIEMIQDMLDAFEIPNIFLDGYEADDVIGTLAKRAKKQKDLLTMIITGDKDSYQLVDKSTVVYKLKKGISDYELVDEKKVDEKYGLTPKQLIDLKALMGDSSDNIPGVPGIGEKTGMKLIQLFSSLDELYKEVEKEEPSKEIKPGQLKKLREHKEDAYIAQKLVTIDTDVPIDFAIKEAEFGDYDTQAVVELFQEYGFKSLMSRLLKQGAFEMQVKPSEKKEGEMTKGYHWVTTKEQTEEMVKSLKEAKQFAFDTETTGVRPFQDALLGLSISWKPGESYYILAEAITDSLKEVFANEKIEKIAHHAKFDVEFLEQNGFKVSNLVFDTKLAAYILAPGDRNIGLKNLAFTELGAQMTNLADLLGKGKKALTMEELAEQKGQQLADYACADADYTFQLYDVFKKRLEKEELDKILTDIELPLVRVLAEMERRGITLNTSTMKHLSRELEERLAELEQDIYKEAKGEFNINSPSQLAEVFFDRLNLPTEGIKKTKKGYSTAASELEKLEQYTPLVGMIQEYREKAKLKSTYVDALPELVNQKTGRIHTNFNQTVAATGRLSSSDPNLQNIPIRTEEGRKIRNAFEAPKGYKFISADYSQIELRVIASLAEDTTMIKAFNDGEDIHKRTAATIYDVPIKKVDKDMRYAAKAINFGVIYGQGPYGLSETAGITYYEAKEFIDTYFEKHKNIKKYLDDMKEMAREKGYVETLFGRRRYIPEINSGVPAVRAGAERVAINMPIQGTAADIMKIAMIDLHALLEEKYTEEEVKLLLSVHDEVVLEVKDELVEEVAEVVRDLMQSPRGIDLAVPVKVDVEIGQKWGALKEK